MTQPPPGRRSATADVDVCRPRPVTSLTTPVARRASGTSALTSVDLPTPECPTNTDVRPASASRTASSGSIAQPSGARPSGTRRVTTTETPSGSYSARSGPGSARSALVRHSRTSIPASYAATTHRSIMRVRGSGSASAVTTTSWSALATITRS